MKKLGLVMLFILLSVTMLFAKGANEKKEVVVYGELNSPHLH